MTLKVVRFHPSESGELRMAWRHVLGGDGAPSRVALATPVDDPTLPPAAFGAVEVLWFGDGPEARRDITAVDQRLRALDPALATGEGSVALVVDEVVGRGADALADRWAEGGPRFKMMSFGRRAPSLTRDEFADRWRQEAGRLGGERIPDQVRGLAYVQDHPVGPDDPAFDAVNEVWFDSLDDLRARAAWLAARPIPADLMDPATCATLCLREELLHA